MMNASLQSDDVTYRQDRATNQNISIFNYNHITRLLQCNNSPAWNIILTKNKKNYNVCCFNINTNFAPFLSQLPEKLIPVNYNRI